MLYGTKRFMHGMETQHQVDVHESVASNSKTTQSPRASANLPQVREWQNPILQGNRSMLAPNHVFFLHLGCDPERTWRRYVPHAARWVLWELLLCSWVATMQQRGERAKAKWH